MSRLSIIVIVLISLGSTGEAADIQTLAPVQAVTVYPNGATITRSISVEVPEGSHRILFPITESAFSAGPPRIRSASGFTLGAQEVLSGYRTDPATVYNADQTTAFGALEQARETRLEQSNRVAFADAKVQAAAARVDFLRSISGGALDSVEPDALANTATMIGEQVSLALSDLQSAREALRADETVLKDLDKALTQAQRDFERTYPPVAPVTMMAVSVDLETAQTIEFTLDYLTYGASWSVDYDLFLTRGEDAALTVSRKVRVAQNTGEVWSGIDLVMSTADPAAQINPSEVYPNQASIFSKQQAPRSSGFELQSRAADSLMIEPIISEFAGMDAGLEIDGLSVSYRYPEPVTVHPGGSALILALDTFELEADVFNRAAPRNDATAFLMARVTNTTPEPLLPGTTSLYRDGAFVGRGQIEMIPNGAEDVLAFGPLDNIRLDFTILENDTGDTGLISRSDQRQQAMEFSVANLTGETQQIETVFALPFSEQEDLDVTVRARPSPDERDFEQKRAVGRWAMELAPGERQVVRLDVTLDWPQGQSLNWQP